MITVRPIREDDRGAWQPLWDGYNAFYGRHGDTALAPEITAATWQHFFDPNEPVFALVAESDGQLLGLAHYLFHRSTTRLGLTCYMQDLFTSQEARGKGVGRALIEGVYRAAKDAGIGRVYWHTYETNTTARLLYDAGLSRLLLAVRDADDRAFRLARSLMLLGPNGRARIKHWRASVVAAALIVIPLAVVTSIVRLAIVTGVVPLAAVLIVIPLAIVTSVIPLAVVVIVVPSAVVPILRSKSLFGDWPAWVVLPFVRPIKVVIAPIARPGDSLIHPVVAPVPIEIEPGANMIARAVADPWVVIAIAGMRDVDDGGIVLRDVDHIGLCGKNLDCAVVIDDLLLRCGGQGAGRLGFTAKLLHRIHDILRLGCECRTEGIHPVRLVRQHVQDAGIVDERFDGGIPRLCVDVILGGIGKRLEPLCRLLDVLGIGRGGEYLG